MPKRVYLGSQNPKIRQCKNVKELGRLSNLGVEVPVQPCMFLGRES